MAAKLGLVGLGLVGTAMAERLRAGGFEVVGFDVETARCEHLEKLGGKVAANPAEVSEQVDRIILSLPDTNVVLQVVEGAAGILEAATPPKYIIDTTTGEPDETAALAQRVAKRGIYFLDAPFSGSSQQLREGDVAFMVGGEKKAFEDCQDIFRALSEKVFYLGACGNGSKAKLASNLILGLNRLVLAEGLVFADKLGLELEGFLEMLKATPAYSAAMDVKGRKMLEGDFTPQARIHQHHKDLSIILKYAQRKGQELPLSKVHLDILQKAIEAGDAELDNSAVIREIQRRQKSQS